MCLHILAAAIILFIANCGGIAPPPPPYCTSDNVGEKTPDFYDCTSFYECNENNTADHKKCPTTESVNPQQLIFDSEKDVRFI